jgi:sulfatase modifying factor 1
VGTRLLWVGSSAVASLGVIALGGCPNPPRTHDRAAEGAGPDAVSAPREAQADDAVTPQMAELDASLDPTVAVSDDPMALHRDTTDGLLTLFAHGPSLDAGQSSPADASLRWVFGPSPGRFSQGNKALAQHAIGKRTCLEGLRGTVLQTDEQRARCRGLPNMVPIYRGGDPSSAKACIDIFEFPNQACELPMVWGTPAQAANVCAIQGKRLCAQSEWNLACAGDPEGKADRVYAYGDDLDLTVCNTNKPHPFGPDGQWLCYVKTAQTAWQTCATETEPSGAFPKCRSRFGVYDQHGNVAEMMTRVGTDKVVYTQLKGSAFFYVDVARKPNEAQKPGTRETYPDQCAFDPRWHVEPLQSSLHSNYHLGFRCCVSI